MKNLFLVLMSISLFTSCIFEGKDFRFMTDAIKGNGTITTQQVSLEEFTSIDCSGMASLTLVRSLDSYLTIEVDENLMEYVKIEFVNKEIKISQTENIDPSDKLKITLPYKEVNSIEVSGACNLRSDELFQTNRLDLDLSGAADLDLTVNLDDLMLDASGASDVNLKGEVKNMEAEISGASDLNSQELKVEYLDIDCSGASNADIIVSGEADIEASGASHIKIKGDGKIVHQSISGAASVDFN